MNPIQRSIFVSSSQKKKVRLPVAKSLAKGSMSKFAKGGLCGEW